MESIYQSRGFASCLKQGFGLVLAHPWKTIKTMGLWALVESVLAVAFTSIYTKVLVDYVTGSLKQSSALPFYGSIILFVLWVILGLFAPYWYCKRISKESKAMAQNEVKKPEDEEAVKGEEVKEPVVKVKKSKVVFGHFPDFAGIFIMSLFLAVLMSILPMFPCLVADQAYLSSVEGHVNFNDPVFIPTSGYVFMLVLSIISMAIALLLELVCPASVMYMYGSIVSGLNKK